MWQTFIDVGIILLAKFFKYSNIFILIQWIKFGAKQHVKRKFSSIIYGYHLNTRSDPSGMPLYLWNKTTEDGRKDQVNHSQQ